uniref:Uncharacterized protein n=1 Tax=Vespula pensylvanica TaxID=30213 RepID=A0A834NWQ4_VESPE|nr:hypothetical protein H0235_010268 [Vespula pensylvanica]
MVEKAKSQSALGSRRYYIAKKVSSDAYIGLQTTDTLATSSKVRDLWRHVGEGLLEHDTKRYEIVFSRENVVHDCTEVEIPEAVGCQSNWGYSQSISVKSISDKFPDKATTNKDPLRLREDTGDYVAEGTRKLPILVFYTGGSVDQSIGLRGPTIQVDR